jgi:hypothetical protein
MRTQIIVLETQHRPDEPGLELHATEMQEMSRRSAWRPEA